jgi:hypothetical protein
MPPEMVLFAGDGYLSGPGKTILFSPRFLALAQTLDV